MGFKNNNRKNNANKTNVNSNIIDKYSKNIENINKISLFFNCNSLLYVNTNYFFLN